MRRQTSKPSGGGIQVRALRRELLQGRRAISGGHYFAVGPEHLGGAADQPHQVRIVIRDQ
jgi:hypothetical protein